MGKLENRFRRFFSAIFDTMQRAGRDEKRLSLLDHKRFLSVFVSIERDEQSPLKTVPQLICVGMPMRLAHGMLVQHQLVKGHILQCWEIAFCRSDAVSAVGLILRLECVKREMVLHFPKI